MHPLLNQYFNFIKRFLPNQSSGSAVGIDIAANECKLVELIKEGEKYKLVSWSIVPIENGDIGGTIKKCLGKLKRPQKSIYTAVFGKGTLIRYISLPRMTLDELKNSFSIESDKYFPFTQDQIYTDCFILDDKGKSKEMSVMAAAAKRELIDQRMKLLNDAGVKPDFIGINPMALVNVINMLGFDAEQKENKTASALLDMGESVSNLTILVDRLPRFTRDISVGGRDLTQSISNALGVSFQEAEKLKADPQDKQAAIVQACESAVNKIVQELTLSFDYFTTEKNMEIKDLYLTGGGALLEGITGAFEKVLGIKVHRWDPFSKIDISSEPDPKIFSRKSFRLGVALGLALYDYD